MHHELALINAICETGEITQVVENGADAIFDEYKDVWKWTHDFYTRYNKVPSKAILKDNFKEFEYLDTSAAPLQFYIDDSKSQSLARNVRSSIAKTIDILKESGPNAALSYMTSSGHSIMKDVGRLKDTNLVDDYRERVDDFRFRAENPDRATLGVPSGISVIDKIWGKFQGGDLVMILGEPGRGKALRYGTPVLTPDGWTNIESLRMGDKVISVDGEPTSVTGIYHQGVRPIYRLHMSDGSWVDADENHLWSVNVDGEDKVMTTLEIFNNPDLIPTLPLVSPVRFSPQETVIDPYDLGFASGKNDSRNIGFIPKEYMLNTPAVRMKTLRGLMDAAGSVDGGVTRFFSRSENMLDDVMFLVRSLGGIAVRVFSSVNIYMKICPFSVDHKVAEWKKASSEMSIQIIHVEKVDQDFAACIMVDHPSKLFVTKDFIVTHNSWLSRLFACNAWREGYSPLVISLEMNKHQEGSRLDTILNAGEYFTSSDLLNARNLSPDDYESWAKSQFEGKHPFHLVTAEGMESANQNMIQAKIDQYSPDIVIVDYLNIMEDANGATDETVRLKNISKDLKRIAERNAIPVIEIAAVTMKEGHGERAPELHEMAWSKGMAYDCDLVLAIHREENSSIFQVVSRKTRRCEPFAFFLDWDLESGKWKEMYENV